MSSSQSQPFHSIERARWPWLLILLCGVIFFAARWQEVPTGAVTDDAYYIEMARSIAEGLGPVISTGPDTQAGDPQIFPPGFPYLLSPLAQLFPNSLSALTIVPALAALIVIMATWFLYTRDSARPLRRMTTLALLCNPWFISWSSRILSDLPYTAISMAAFLVILKAHEQKYCRKITLAAAVLFCVAAISVRTIGWASVAAITTFLLSQRQWISGISFPIAVTVILIPTWVSGDHFNGPLTAAYSEQMLANSGSTLWQLIATNLAGYVAELSVLLLPIFGNPLANFFESNGVGILYKIFVYGSGATALVLIIKGAKDGLRNHATAALAFLMTAYILFYFMALAVFDGYPSGVQTRLLLPILPFLIWLVLNGARTISYRLTYWVVAAMICAALAHNTWRVVHPLSTSLETDGHGLVDLAVGSNWIKDNSQISDVIMTQEPLVRHIHWQRNVVHFPNQITFAEVLAQCEKFAVRLVFIGPTVSGQPRALNDANIEMLQLLDDHPQRFSSVMADSQQSVFLYRFIPTPQ